MPKDRRVNSLDRASLSPYSCSSKVSELNNPDASSPQVGDEKEWEEARCPICMEPPHNAVLLLCSSRDKGCRPFICDTSYRHSNCLDQFRKSSLSASEGEQSPLLCPLCRGLITGFDAVQPARQFMNAKPRSCSLETCHFSGNYSELRKHARLEHPSERPSEASPTRQSNWTILEQQREIEDALAHQSDIDYDWGGWPDWDELDDDLWSDDSFFDFSSGMLDIDDDLVDEMFSGLSLSFFSLYSPSLEEEEEMTMMDSGGSRNSGRRTGLSTNLGSRTNNEVVNPLPNSRSRSGHGHHRENDVISSRSRSSYHRENGSNSRSGYRREAGSTTSRSRSSYHREIDTPQNSRSRSSNDREHALPSSRARTRYYNNRGDDRSVRRSSARHLPGSSRQRRHDF